MPKGIPLTEEEQSRRRREIFDAAVVLFIEKGFTETSMREIAEAAGVGKSTLYDYFKTKDDILISFFTDEVQAMTDTAREISQKDISARDKLIQITVQHVEYLTANKNFYLKLSLEAQRLAQLNQRRIQVSRHTYQDLLCRLIETGIADGSFRTVDPLLAVRIISSALSQVVFTTRPTGSPQEMLTAALDILFHGLEA